MSQLTAGTIRARQQEQSRKVCPFVSVSWLAAILFPIHFLFMRIYFKIEVSGAHHIPASGPFILAPVHRSRWDPFMLYSPWLGHILHFMTSHDEVVGVQGWFMRRLGAFPINTQRPSSSVIRHCKELISLGEALVIFPEGNLFYYEPGEVHPLKPGVAWLALNCQRDLGDVNLAIIPVRLVYSERVASHGWEVARIVPSELIAVSDFAGFPVERGGGFG